MWVIVVVCVWLAPLSAFHGLACSTSWWCSYYWYQHWLAVIALCVSGRWRVMCSGHGHFCVSLCIFCLSVHRHIPTLLHRPSVACPRWSVAVSMICRERTRSLAFHRHHSPSDRWYAGALEVSSCLLVVRVTLSSCALLGRFTIGAHVSLQHSAECETSASACTRSMPGLRCCLMREFRLGVQKYFVVAEISN